MRYQKKKIIDGSAIKPSDVVIGIESSGLHSNGYSIVNYLARRLKLNYCNRPELLTPTTIYAPLIMKLLEEFPIVGMAHITGGGLLSNVSRCIPEGLKADINYNSWNLPEIFQKIMLAGEIPEEEMKRVFNLGIGFCLVVPPEAEDEVRMLITPYHECWTIGEVVVE